MKEATIANFLASAQSLAQRDGAVEVRAEDAGETVGTTYKVRLLELLGDGEMLIDMPTQAGAASELYRGAAVSVLVIEGVRRLVGYCRVLGTEQYELAGGQRTRSLRLSRPGAVESAQRRRFFRVNAGGSVTHPVELALLDPGGGPGKLPGVKPLHAALLNIGGGGMGVTIDHSRELGATLRRTTRFQATVQLPGPGEPLRVAMRLVHVQPTQGNTLYLGFEFDCVGTAEQRRVEDQVVRVATCLQRQQIRRQRGA